MSYKDRYDEWFGMVWDIDLGQDHFLKFLGWHPDRDLNPQYENIPDIPKCCGFIGHSTKEGKHCTSAVHFNLPNVDKIFKPEQIWQVLSWEPLTLSPSILCKRCGDHGFIENGKWRSC